ncbi:MAG: hypothetical protein E7L01_01855 [Paenibacillus macerans]|uniref:hypothetical protein n=1 Tax=Paenibacillus TaxID=44249 RepID=UPI00290EA76A|nr:hypothetical protein [Paenibacillus macerans]MDU7472094.1 hypothetical protein [Paenibacillus macerans]
MSDKGDERDMINVQDRLTEVNKKVDSIIDDIWVKAELNYKKLEAENKNKNRKCKEGGERD